MQRIGRTFLKLVAAGTLALASLGTSGCYDEVYGDPAYYPSDAIVATEEPVYYDGFPTYFYGGRWFYRDGNRWSYYRSEPSYLRQYRGAHPAVRRGGVRAGARGGARGGHGGRR